MNKFIRKITEWQMAECKSLSYQPFLQRIKAPRMGCNEEALNSGFAPSVYVSQSPLAKPCAFLRNARVCRINLFCKE